MIGSGTQELRSSEVQRFRGSRVQSFKNSVSRMGSAHACATPEIRGRWVARNAVIPGNVGGWCQLTSWSICVVALIWVIVSKHPGTGCNADVAQW